MRPLIFHPGQSSIFAAALCVVTLGYSQDIHSPEDLKAERALRQKTPDWGLALSYLLQAHERNRNSPERYYQIAACLQNTNRPLAAMAWYQAYRMAPGADSQKVRIAAQQVELLEVDVQSKIGNLFAEAVKIGEQQIKEKVIPGLARTRTTDNLFLLPILQAEAGMPVEALTTEKRIGALNVRPSKSSQIVDSRLRFRLRHQSVNPKVRYLYAAAIAGDAATVAGEVGKASAQPPSREELDEKARLGHTLQEECVWLAELIRFNHNQESNHRLALAERILRRDPMADLDARAAAILREPNATYIPVQLSALALDIGQSMLEVRAMRPENARPEISEATRIWATRKLEYYRVMGPDDDELYVIIKKAAPGLRRQ